MADEGQQSAGETQDGTNAGQGGEGNQGTSQSGAQGAGESQGAQNAQGSQNGSQGTNGSQASQEGNQASPPSYSDQVAAITDPKVKDFAGRFTTVEDLAKSGLQFRQKLSDSFQVPGEDATDEEKANFRAKALGVPEKPEGYEVKQPDVLPKALAPAEDGSTPILDAFKAKAHELGAPPNVVQGLYDFFVTDIVKAGEDITAQQDQAFLEQGTQALRKEWGADYDSNVKLAGMAFVAWGENAGVPQHEMAFLLENARLDGQPLGSHPSFLKVGATLGKRMQEPGGELLLGIDETQIADAETKMRQLTKEGVDAQNRGDRDTAKAKFDERDALAKRVYGSAPIVGSEARTL